MQAKQLFSNWNLGINWRYNLLYELNVIWQFIWRDVWATIIPGLLFLLAAWHIHPSSGVQLLWVLGCGIVYFLLYILPFALSNQIVGIEEDRINKPDRPLVRGIVSYQGAQVRWVVSMGLFSLVGWWLGVLEWTLLWQVCIIAHNFGGLAKHWIGKNLIMGIGQIAQLGAAWQLITPLTSITWRWILLIAIVSIPLVALQDLRDIDGDRATGRNTFPIAFGETATRIMLSFGFGLLPVATHLGLMMPAENTWMTILCDVALAAISWTIATRVILFRNAKADHHTYMMFLYWYCLVLGSAIFVL